MRIFAVFFTLTALIISGECKEYIYAQKIKDINCKVKAVITETDGITIISASDDYYGITNEVRTKKDKGVFEWSFTDLKNDSLLKGIRENNIIRITGRYKGHEFKRENGIDDRPWHQIFTWDMQDFVASSEKRMEFWAIRPDNPESCGVLVAYKDKEEKISVNGIEAETVNVKVTLAGLLSIFWTGDYWFRKDDMLYVKSKPSNDILVELIKE